MESNIKLNCLAWLEIPYFIGVNFESTFPAKYTPEITVELKIKFRNDLIRVSTSNRWMRSYDEYLQNYPQPLTEVIIPRYIIETDLTLEILLKTIDCPICILIN